MLKQNNITNVIHFVVRFFFTRLKQSAGSGTGRKDNGVYFVYIYCIYLNIVIAEFWKNDKK